MLSITLIDGRIGMPMPWVQARSPFMPWLAASLRLATVKAEPSARATVATAVRYAQPATRRPSAGCSISRTVSGRSKRRRRSALVTTETELIAMAAEARIGSRRSPSTP